MPIVFNCQMGRGRTTTGMLLGSLIRIWLLKQCDNYIKKYVYYLYNRKHNNHQHFLMVILVVLIDY